MATWQRAAVALALLAGLVASDGTAQGAPHPAGASQSLFVVDVIVRGTPPPGATITIRVPDATTDDARVHDVDLATVGDTPPDIVTEVGTVTRHLFVDPQDDAGASAVDYECELVGFMTAPHPSSFCEERMTPDVEAPGPHVFARFDGNVNQHANTTVTLTFGTCDGRPVDTFLAQGEAPTAGPDVVLGTPGPDVVNGGGGNDLVCGGGGRDTLRGGDGRDRLLGGGAADRLEGGLRGDVLLGGVGTDTLLGAGGNDALDGGADRDTCNGGRSRTRRSAVRSAMAFRSSTEGQEGKT